MIKFKWYRWMKSFLGYSSFIHTNKDDKTTYILVRGDRSIVENLQDQFTQEY